MNKTLRFGATMLTAGAILGASITFAATKNFQDVSMNDWFYNDVQKMVSYGVVAGYDDNTYRPANSVNRAELAAMLSRYDMYLRGEMYTKTELEMVLKAAGVDISGISLETETNTEANMNMNMNMNANENTNTSGTATLDLQAMAAAGFNGTLSVDKATFAPGEEITITYDFPVQLESSTAWTGIVPHATARTEEENRTAVMSTTDYTWAYMTGELQGTMQLTAPTKPGTYDIRLISSDTEGVELYSITITVQ